MTEFRVSEIYPCLQGEGFSMGIPSVLVRFQGCNLRCAWCDTPHALDRDAEAGQGFSLEALAQKIFNASDAAHPPIRHLMLTGGEPTLQPLHRLLGHLNADATEESRWTAEVESNGTRIPHRTFPDFTQHDYASFQWNISPKLGSSQMHPHEPALTHWAALSRAGGRVFFKFVVKKTTAESDLAEILAVVARQRIPRRQVFLMAEGNLRASQVDAAWLHDLALAHNLRFTPRLHVVLFGDKRGV